MGNTANRINDFLCIEIDSSDLTECIAIAREFRCCTSTFIIGNTALLCHGLHIVHAISELGISNIILDAKILSPVSPGVKSFLKEISRLFKVKALTCSLFVAPKDVIALLEILNTVAFDLNRPPLFLIINCTHGNFRIPQISSLVLQGVFDYLLPDSSVSHVKKELPNLRVWSRCICTPRELEYVAKPDNPTIQSLLDSGVNYVIYSGLPFCYDSLSDSAEIIMKKSRFIKSCKKDISFTSKTKLYKI